METHLIIPRSNQTLRDNVFRIVLTYFGSVTLFIVAGWISRGLIPKVRYITFLKIINN